MEHHDRNENRDKRVSTASAPAGHRLSSRRTTLRFASSKIKLASNPLAPQSDEESETEEHLIGAQQDRHDNFEEGGSTASRTSAEVTSHPLKVYPEEVKEKPLKFTKRHSAHPSELFYDLWFVANLTVFATVHPIVDKQTLYSFVGYFFLLWVTWLVTTVFDARFFADGILGRLARACHLGVMMGFSVVAVVFNESELIEPIFQATCFFLMFSRIILACQYGVVAWHVRHHRQGKNVLTYAIALHVIPAVLYLVLALVMPPKDNKHFVAAWYIIGGGEMFAVLLHATISTTLSFSGTHFNERLNLLTLIVMGEGVIILSKNMTKIVEYTYVKGELHEWSPALIGILVCSASVLYITFQLYFDWMHHHNHMNAVKQALWTAIHLPFHVALVLMAEGGSQWGLWWRAMEACKSAERHISEAVTDAVSYEGKTEAVTEAIQDAVLKIFKKYGASTSSGSEEVESLENALNHIENIPDSFWRSKDRSDDMMKQFLDGYLSAIGTAINSISHAFGLHYDEKKEEDVKTPTSMMEAEAEGIRQTTERLVLVFIYMFMAAGAVLLLLMMMHVLSKRRGWSYFNMFRTSLVVIAGLGLSLVSLLATNDSMVIGFLQTPWQLPTITIVFATVLILTHIPHPPRIFVKRNNHSDDVEMGQVPASFEPTRLEQPVRGEDTAYQSPQVGEGSEVAPAQPLSRVKTLQRSLTTIGRTIGNIRIEAGRYEPVDEDRNQEDGEDGNRLSENRQSVGGPGLLIHRNAMYSF